MEVADCLEEKVLAKLPHLNGSFHSNVLLPLCQSSLEAIYCISPAAGPSQPCGSLSWRRKAGGCFGQTATLWASTGTTTCGGWRGRAGEGRRSLRSTDKGRMRPWTASPLELSGAGTLLALHLAQSPPQILCFPHGRGERWR